MRMAIVLVATVFLASCAREPVVMTSTIDVVTLRYFGDADKEAAQKASDECGKYNRRARYRNAHATGTGEREAIYDCLPN